MSVNESVDPPTITVGINGKSSTANLPAGSGDSFTHTLTGSGDKALKTALDSLPLYTTFIYTDSSYATAGIFQKITEGYCLGTGIYTVATKDFPFFGLNIRSDIWSVGRFNPRQDSDGLSVYVIENSNNANNWTIRY